MLTVGVDAHKRVTMAVAIDAAGRAVARWRGPNSVEGWQQLAAWAAARDAEVRWGIEGAGNYGRGLAQRLMGAGATVYEVNARWTAAGRRRARTPGKSDSLDAHAVALVVWREAGTLPPVAADDETGVCEILDRGALAGES
jgi:transposase